MLVLILTLALSCDAPTPVPSSTPSSAPATHSSLPTYTQVVSTYPPGVELCRTEIAIEKVEPDGAWWIRGDFEIRQGVKQIQCYGTRVTLEVAVTLDGKEYPAGTKLTVDKDLNWIEVSNWD